MSDPDPRQPTRQDLIRWSEALAGIAKTGLGFSGEREDRRLVAGKIGQADAVGIACEDERAGCSQH